MTDHKFEPGQLVLARYNVGGGATWHLQHFSHLTSGECPFNTITGYSFAQCIPFNDDTKHLQNTTRGYEPPKPPHEYEWGQKVEVLIHRCWRKGVFIKNKRCTSQPIIVAIQGYDDTCHVAEKDIRPLPDDTAAR